MDLFDYTQKKYWGAPWYPYWSLMLATVLFGFFGGDHLWLRSPLSGLLKLVVNVLTFGLWYFYDIIQVMTESETVQSYGLSAPLLGPLGIGAGMFRSGEEGETTSKSPLRYIAYIILLIVPFTFGIEYAVAGDMGGAAFKFITSLFWFILFPISILYTIINFFHAAVTPKSLFEAGTYHMFPASFFLGLRWSAAAGVLGPRDVPDPDAACSAGFGAIFAPVMELAKVAIGSVTAPAAAAVSTVSAAVSGVAEAVKTGADVVVKTGQTVGATLDAAQGLAAGLGSASGALTQGLATGFSSASGAVDKQIQEKAVGLTQLGGSSISGAYEPTIGDWTIIAGMCGLFAYTAFNKYKEWSQKKKEKEHALYNGVPIPNATT
jgi:hypothetical protein